MTRSAKPDRSEGFAALPESAIEFVEWEWSAVEPYYADLETRPVTADNVSTWLADWSRLAELVDEGLTRLWVERSLDTKDEAREKRYQTYFSRIKTPSEKHDQRLKQKLLGSGLRPEGFDVPLRNLRTQVELFRVENLDLLEEEQRLSNEYDRIVGAQTVEWDGEQITLIKLSQVLEEPERDRRERAWTLYMERILEDRVALNDLWNRFLDLRMRMAANADLPDYRAFRWRQMLRFDYSDRDCRSFHDAIEAVAVPAASGILERRRRQLGVKRLRPWDLDVNPLGREPLTPFGNSEELSQKAAAVFEALDPQLGRYFRQMQSDGMLDLGNRPGKAPGAYSYPFAAVRQPFVFMNAVGRQSDVQTLFHEAGHAFHVFESAALPYYHQLHVTAEFAEVASMGMELLAAPYLTLDFYSERDAARHLTDDLESLLLFWPYMAVVDAFQHWAYENPDSARDHEQCDAYWTDLWGRFMPVVDWSGLEPQRATGWHRKLHIFRYPFYYVDYGLAQLGSVQIWAKSLQDQASSVADYRRALALGGTETLPRLFQIAGADFAFDANTLSAAVSLVETELNKLRDSAGG